MLELSRPFANATAVIVLLGTAALAVPSFAASPGNMAPNTVDNSATSTDQSDMSSTNSSSSDSTTSMKPSKVKNQADMDAEMKKHVDVRIKTLHDELKVTKDQDGQWETVAQAMRDSEEKMRKVVDARHANVGNMTAVDDIKSYQEVAQAHADGLAKFIAAFEPFYNSLSDDQKKTADAFFSKSQMHHHHAMKKNSGKAITTTPSYPNQ